MTDMVPRRRTGGREGRIAARAAAHIEHVPFLTRTLKPFEVLDEEGLALIEHNADTILEEVGREFRGDPEALARCSRTRAPTSRANGCGSRGGCAARSSRRRRRGSSRSTRAIPSEPCASATRTRCSRPNYGSPFVRDLDNGRRYGTIEDFRNFVKLDLHDARTCTTPAARCASRSTCR